MTLPRLILASGSPRRQDLLKQAGFEFDVIVPGIEEVGVPGESPEAQAERLAIAKARAIVDRVGAQTCIIAADTMVVFEGTILGKPEDEAQARGMLQSLGGRDHRVLTGFALICRAEDRIEFGVEESHVSMRALDADEIRAYVMGGEPMDKAGAYAVQGEGARFIEKIRGSRSNVIGLPMERVIPALERFGIPRQ